MSDTKATPRPWKVVGRGLVRDSAGKVVADCEYHSALTTAEVAANADLIVLAVNSHDELLAACKDLLSGWKYIRATHGDLYGVGWARAENNARAAILKAEPKP